MPEVAMYARLQKSRFDAVVTESHNQEAVLLFSRVSAAAEREGARSFNTVDWRLQKIMMVFQRRSQNLTLICVLALWDYFAPGVYCSLSCLFHIMFTSCELFKRLWSFFFSEFSPLVLVLVHCHSDCLTCSRSPDHCDLCQDPTKLLQNGRCVHSCGLGFYQAGGVCLGMATQREGYIGLKRLTVGFILQLSHGIVTEGATMPGNSHL